MKKILGLDLGTNSIGWALVNEAEISSIIIKLVAQSMKLLQKIFFYDILNFDDALTIKG